jgi:hypothetical protein
MPLLTESVPSLFLRAALTLKAEEARLNSRFGFPKYDRCKINFSLDSEEPTASIWARVPCSDTTVSGIRMFYPINYLESDSVSDSVVINLFRAGLTIGVIQSSDSDTDFRTIEAILPIPFGLAVPTLPNVEIPANGIDRSQYRVNISVVNGFAIITALIPLSVAISSNGGLSVTAIDFFNP